MEKKMQKQTKDYFKEDKKKFLIYCKTNKRLSNDSIKGYGFDIDSFTKYLLSVTPPVLNFLDVTKEMLDGYVVYLDKYAVKTIRRRLAGVQSLFNYLEYVGKLSDNPFKTFKLKIREVHKLRTSLSIDEINTFLKAAYDSKPYSKIYKMEDIKPYSRDFIWLRNIAILELLFAGGMRVSELCNIKFEDVNLKGMTILIHGKGNKERRVYLENPEIIKVINEYYLIRKNVNIYMPYLFITKNLDQLTTASVRNLVRKYLKFTNIEKNVTPHVFRHTFATLLLEEGVDIKYIQDFLGHSSISTTQLYLHTSENKKRSIIASKHPRKQFTLKTEY